MSGPAYQRRADVMFTVLDGEVLALDALHGHCFGMNPVASAVWNLLEQPRTLADLCEELEGEFDVGPERCREEVQQLLVQLQQEKLVQLHPVS